MNTKISLILLIIVLFLTAIVLLGEVVIPKVRKYLMLKDLMSRNTSVIWAQRDPSREYNPIHKNKLYYYELGGQVTLLEDEYYFFDMVLNSDGTRMLAFTGYKEDFEIVEYDINERELTSILTSEQVENYLNKNGYENPITSREGFNVQYYDNENKISFIYDDFLMGYSPQEGLKVIYTFESGGERSYSWMENDTALLLNDKYELINYNIMTGKRITLIEQSRPFNFVLSIDESYIIYEDRKTKSLYRYDLKSGNMNRLCGISDSRPELIISKDSRYILCHDTIWSFIAYTTKPIIYIIDVESGKKYYVREFDYGYGIAGVTWNQ